MVVFPIYVRDDAGDIIAYSSIDKMQGYMEPIDVSNREYEAWDGDGHRLELNVGKPKAEWLKISRSDGVLQPAEFDEVKAKAVPYRDPEPLLKGLGRLLGIVKH